MLVLSGSAYVRRRATAALAGTGDVLTSTTPAAALTALREADVDLVLLDVAVPDLVRTQHALLARSPGVHVVLHGAEPCEELLLAALRAGARGYLPSTMDAVSLCRAVLAVLDGEVAVPRSLTSRLVDALAPAGAPPAWAARLTAKELEVAELLAGGAGTAEIAAELGVSQVTVRTHVAALVRKLGVSTRQEAVALLGRVST